MTPATSEPKRFCKDCVREYSEGGGPESLPVKPRPAPHQGPRCATHWREYRKAAKERNHANHVARTYGLGEHDYGKIYEAQGGTCAICGRATGATRKLSVDHDHSCCSGPVSCGYCVRGLLCRPCNDFLGYVRDDWQAFARGVKYLTGKRASETVLGKRRTS
jgi:hypothetical protein